MLIQAVTACQVPFAFQQKLSAHKTPTLCDAIPSFEAMLSIWTKMQENAQLSESLVIQEGLDKLTVYRDRTNPVPAYAIAMSTFVFAGKGSNMKLNLPTVLNPSQKLQYYTDHEPEKLVWAKGLLRETVSTPCYVKTFYESHSSCHCSFNHTITVTNNHVQVLETLRLSHLLRSIVQRALDNPLQFGYLYVAHTALDSACRLVLQTTFLDSQDLQQT
jgi:hypothetical protein